MIIMDLTWFIENLDTIYLIITTALSLGWLIAKLTPNKKDDEIIGKLQKFFDVFNGNKVKIELKR